MGMIVILVGGEKSLCCYRAIASVQELTYKVFAEKYTVRGQKTDMRRTLPIEVIKVTHYQLDNIR